MVAQRRVITPVCQRWRDQRGSYRPAREVLSLARYELVEDASEEPCKGFVLQQHYAGTWPAARFRHRVVDTGTLETVGAIVYSQPARDDVFAGLPGEAGQQVELGRLVLLDEVPANAESALVAESMRRLSRNHGIAAVLSFSDPVPRTTAAGEQVFKGHIGTVYQALNAWFSGRATARTLPLLPDGRTLSPRALQKIRGRERGHAYAEEQLARAGAAVGLHVEQLRPEADREEARAWLRRWLWRVARPLRHGGNLRYLFGLDRAGKKAIRRSFPNGTDGSTGDDYPKFHTLAALAPRRAA